MLSLHDKKASYQPKSREYPETWPGYAWAILIASIGGIISLIPFATANTLGISSTDDLIKGQWHLISNSTFLDNNNNAAKNSPIAITDWKGKFSSNQDMITGQLTDSITGSEFKSINGHVSGILRANILSLSYGSKDLHGSGSGSWILKYQQDGAQTFVGRSIGWDCTREIVTACPAIFTKNTKLAIEKYESHLAIPCTKFSLVLPDNDQAGVSKSICS